MLLKGILGETEGVKPGPEIFGEYVVSLSTARLLLMHTVVDILLAVSKVPLVWIL